MNIVLVPRTHCGGWAFTRLAPYLRAAGHAVYTPTLTGLGERVHLSHTGIDLELHIQDVINVLHFEDLDDVVLVGWGYGGMVVTGVADREPGRVSRLVYLNGFVPRNGQSIERLAPGAWYDVIREQQLMARGTPAEGLYLHASEAFYRDFIADAAVRAWFAARVTPQSLRTFEQTIRLTSPPPRGIPRAYICCPEGEAGPMSGHFEQVAEWFAEIPGWEFVRRPLGHFAPVTLPAETAATLLEFIRPVAPTGPAEPPPRSDR